MSYRRPSPFLPRSFTDARAFGTNPFFLKDSRATWAAHYNTSSLASSLQDRLDATALLGIKVVRLGIAIVVVHARAKVARTGRTGQTGRRGQHEARVAHAHRLLEAKRGERSLFGRTVAAVHTPAASAVVLAQGVVKPFAAPEADRHKLVWNPRNLARLELGTEDVLSRLNQNYQLRKKVFILYIIKKAPGRPPRARSVFDASPPPSPGSSW